MGREGELRLVVVRELSLAKTLVLVWWGVARRKTMFVEPVSVPQTDPHSECDVSYVYSKEKQVQCVQVWKFAESVLPSMLILQSSTPV